MFIVREKMRKSGLGARILFILVGIGFNRFEEVK